MNTNSQNILLIDKVSFAYHNKLNKNEIFKDFCCKFKKGKFTSIIGPSGSGKTTLLKLISGLINYTSGEIKFEGNIVKSVISDITLVQQNNSLMPWLNVYQNIALGDINKIKTSRKLKNLIINIGLQEFSNFYPHQLSGGLIQRVALARALFFKPKLLLLDEPFAALDNLSREIISSELISTIKKETLSIIMVTHSIEEAALLSDEVLITGLAPITVVKKYSPPKNKKSIPWYKLGLRKSLENKCFRDYIKLIRESSYNVLKEKIAIEIQK